MKKYFKKLSFIVCITVLNFLVIFSVLSAKEMDTKISKDYTLNSVIIPDSIYFDDISYFSENSLPPRKKYFNMPVYEYGYYYNGILELTKYQSTGDGYIGMYSGYLNRDKPIR